MIVVLACVYSLTKTANWLLTNMASRHHFHAPVLYYLHRYFCVHRLTFGGRLDDYILTYEVLLIARGVNAVACSGFND